MEERKTLREVTLETDGVEMENTPSWIVRSRTSAVFSDFFASEYGEIDEDSEISERDAIIDMLDRHDIRRRTQEEIWSEFQTDSRENLDIGEIFQMLMGGEMDPEKLKEMSSSYNFAIAVQMYQTYYSMTMN